MIITLVGFRKVEYKNKDGREVKGVEVHGVFMDNTDDKYEGSPCFISYFPDLDASSLLLGEVYYINTEISMFNGKPTARFTSLTLATDLKRDGK